MSQKKSIRKTGTTVRVEKLFQRIPVRRNIFVKNDKKEIQKTYTTLMGNGSSNVIMFSILFAFFTL